MNELFVVLITGWGCAVITMPIGGGLGKNEIKRLKAGQRRRDTEILRLKNELEAGRNEGHGA